jgi:hypothetical protein
MSKKAKFAVLMLLFLVCGELMIYLSDPYLVGYVQAFKNPLLGWFGVFLVILGVFMPLGYDAKEARPLEILYNIEE